MELNSVLLTEASKPEPIQRSGVSNRCELALRAASAPIDRFGDGV